MVNDKEQVVKKTKSTSSKQSWLNRNVFGMALTSFFSDAGHEAATSILPMFLASIGAPAAALGAIEGVADAISSFVKLASGWISDRIGKRKLIVVSGYALTGLSTGLFALAQSWPFVLITRSIGWFGRGIRGPARDAMLVESVPSKFRGRAFGFHRAGDTLGAIVGPALALSLITLFAGKEATTTTYRQIFLITMIPGILSALSFAVLVKEGLHSSPQRVGLFKSIHLLPGNFKRFLIGVGIFGAGDFAHSLLILRAVQILTPQIGAVQAGQVALILYIIHNVFYTGMSYPVGALADRIGKRGLLAASYALAAVMALGWIFTGPSIPVLIGLFAIGGTFVAAEEVLEGAMSADLLANVGRGTGYGVLATVNGLGDFLSSVIVGLLWTAVAPAAGFVYSAVLFSAGAIMVYRLR